MDTVLTYLRDLNVVSIAFRFLLAVLCGSIIGLERGKKRHAAGLRTHIVVCIGAAAVMIVNQYISLYLSPGSDPARMGAQVISGIGFLGAGTIVITGHHHGRQVKGLTTAAGLWASACVGLAVGVGFYEGAIIMCAFLFGVIAVLHKLEYRYVKGASSMQVYVEYEDRLPFSAVLKVIREEGWHMSDLERLGSDARSGVGVLLELHCPLRSDARERLVQHLNDCPGVFFAEEI